MTDITRILLDSNRWGRRVNDSCAPAPEPPGCQPGGSLQISQIVKERFADAHPRPVGGLRRSQDCRNRATPRDAAKDPPDQAACAEAIENAVYDLKAVNPDRQAEEDTRTPEELLDLIEQKGREVLEALATLRAI